MSLNVNKAHGNDGILVRMIKVSDKSLVQPLSLIFRGYLTGEIYVYGIFVEHSHEIFQVHSESIPNETLGNITKQCSGNIEYRNIP